MSAATDPCPCGSQKTLGECCGPFLDGESLPLTAEQLMRSRYCAYKLQKIEYLRETLWPKYQARFDHFGVSRWAAENHWTGLKVLSSEKGGTTDRQGTVLFEASYLSCGTLQVHREMSLFRKKSGRWYYVEGLAQDF
ncbi:YchJ family protein [Cohaesibacter gelatinilyticus]|uniref:SEC-C motif-containing protein n=1 Tax=Cohaesibacter gelatinilyticus TaxID=372072 RepID=A0A285PGB5_9HYPH|nr:YchJ family metal-binding protein [Cohaesibacter gelatinilyticus]SNZ20488.1 SEC-C motif-containing protein [Cohaesibacter gelatinilyticus]